MNTMKTYMVAGLAVWLSVPAAWACGGFFCDNSAPVIQMGEQIAFGVDGNAVDVHVRIDYEGPSESFSWVLPLPAQPTVSVSDQALFDTLIAQTNPQMFTTWSDSPGCRFPEMDFDSASGFGDGMDSADSVEELNESPGVVVLDSGQAGPYDYYVVEAAPGAETGALFNWLNENGYQQPVTAEPLVDYYSAIGFKFVAIRLQKDQSTGAIRPLRLQYESPTYACVPLRLTSIAAGDDMPITAWIFAKARAIPMNYLHVTLNPEAFDWIRCGQPQGSRSDFGFQSYFPSQCDYNALLGEAVDEAGGRAFVTEFAGDTPAGQVLSPWMEDYLKELEDQGLSDKDFFLDIVSMFSSSAGLSSVLANFQNQLDNMDGELCTDAAQEDEQWVWDTYSWCLPDDVKIDRKLLTDDVKLFIIEPLAGAQSLFDNYAYATRLSTTMSPSEMTLDPLFSFNPDLPKVESTTTAVAEPVCIDGDPFAIRLKLPNGGTKIIYGEFGFGFTPESGYLSEDAAGMVQVLNESGPPLLISESDIAREQLVIEGRGPSEGRSDVEANEDDTITDPTGTFGQDPESRIDEQAQAPERSASDDGCTAAHGPQSRRGYVLLFGLLGVAFIARRRRAGNTPVQ